MAGENDENDEGDWSPDDDQNATQADEPTQSRDGHDGAGYARSRNGDSNVDFERFGKLGGAVFGIVGLGTVLTLFLFSTLSSSGSTLGGGFVGGTGGGNELFFAVTSTFTVVVQFGALVAIGVGVLVAGLEDVEGSEPQHAAVTAGVGAGATLIVLAVLLVGLAPNGVQIDVGELVGPVIGATVGITATAAGAAYLSNELPDL